MFLPGSLCRGSSLSRIYLDPSHHLRHQHPQEMCRSARHVEHSDAAEGIVDRIVVYAGRS